MRSERLSPLVLERRHFRRATRAERWAIFAILAAAVVATAWFSGRLVDFDPAKAADLLSGAVERWRDASAGGIMLSLAFVLVIVAEIWGELRKGGLGLYQVNLEPLHARMRAYKSGAQ